MNILLAGSTGVIGRRLLPKLVEVGHDVTAITRSPERAAQLEAPSVRGVACDVLDRDRLGRVFDEVEPEVVIHQLTSLPKKIDPRKIQRDLAATNRLRTQGTANLAEAAARVGSRRLISQSVAFAYRPGDPALAVEADPLYTDAPAAFLPMIEALKALERHTLDTDGPEGVVLRFGYFYGPGTIYARDGSFAADVLARRMPLVGTSQGQFSFVHLDDAADATLAAIADAPTGTYNIVDDEPIPIADWLPWYAEQLGAKPPMRVPRLLGRLLAGPYADYLMNQQRGASNAKARQLLGWSPRHTSWRTGMRSELQGSEAPKT